MENERAVRTAHNQLRKLEVVREREVDEALGAIMTHLNGRRLIFWLLSLGKPGQNPFTGNTLSTMFQCGELNVAQQLQARLLRVCPKLYIQMLEEMEDERRKDGERLASAGSGGSAEFGEPDDPE